MSTCLLIELFLPWASLGILFLRRVRAGTRRSNTLDHVADGRAKVEPMGRGRYLLQESDRIERRSGKGRSAVVVVGGLNATHDVPAM